MSGILDTALAVTVLIRPRRIIGFLIPDVTLDEVARDNLVITQHPVEQGVQLSDHAYATPIELEMSLGWSNGTTGLFGRTALIYQELLLLQKALEPFTVYTPGRAYRNMLIRTLEKHTNAQIADSLMVRVVLQQVITATTMTMAIATAATQALPQKTAPILEAGTRQLLPAKVSFS